MKQIIYASDLDRTLIFSERFFGEYPCDEELAIVEYKGERVVSRVPTKVLDKLHDINNNEGVQFVPVTSRSLEEYKRVELGFIPEYAIVSNGAIILHNGEILEDWRAYVTKNVDKVELLKLLMDLMELKSMSRKPEVVDGASIFMKTDNEAQWDYEVVRLADLYPMWDFYRVKSKCYIVPRHITKQVALRWLWTRLDKPCIVASGDSEVDIPMLTIANKAVIPDHSDIFKDKLAESGNIVSGGAMSPLQTMDIVLKELGV